MSSASLVVLAIGLVPCLLAIALRVNAILLFVSVVGGNLLAWSFAADAAIVLQSIMGGGDSVMVSRLILQFIPVMMMLLLARKTAGKNSAILHIVPIMFVCALLLVYSLEIVPASLANDFKNTETGHQFAQARNIIIGAAVISQLLLIWSTHRPERSHKKHGKHKA
ncbi:hypothetical protein E6P97_01905 [Patescibacteria group bacterium]|nr:MAG: hypothetical protein E6P97_01905 [Patescibacteria group bacterium]